jgi:hypothetical protein
MVVRLVPQRDSIGCTGDFLTTVANFASETRGTIFVKPNLLYFTKSCKTLNQRGQLHELHNDLDAEYLPGMNTDLPAQNSHQKYRIFDSMSPDQLTSH